MHLRTGPGLRASTSLLASATTNARGRRLVRFPITSALYRIVSVSSEPYVVTGK